MAALLYEKRDRVAHLTLNRPEVKNAIDPELNDQLWDAWRDFRDDDDVDVAIVTGNGDAFCSGGDRNRWIPQWVGRDAMDVRRVVDDGFAGGITRGLHRIYKPVIGAINGWALGGGLELALACDIRIASERAMFGTQLVRYGFHTADGGVVRLLNYCGAGVALDLLLSGEPIDAQRARECNLVTRVVPHDRLLDEAERLARVMVEHDQVALRSAKETLFDVIGRDLDDQLRVEALYGYALSARGPETQGRLERYAGSGAGGNGR